ncbi:M15 family metallopeptidase [Nocardia sp. NPDC057272]|uniref:M15 family metallopeptidase n=1 Tax=Nocardia sp. NPDC057272 TaxID=3346079 RepID=UPI003641D516
MSFRSAYGYNHSENGWRMVNRDGCVVANVLPWTDTAPIRAGVAATILNAWLLWYHLHVEPIDSPVWGWSRENDVPNSNHLSGTAVDINAPRYPWGARTMPADRISKVRKGLELFEGCVFWGADWSRADEMHFQIGLPEGHPHLDKFAAALDAGHLGIYAGGPDNGDDDMTENERKMLADVHRELTQVYPSRSRYRDGDGGVDTLAGMVLNADARIHEDAVERAALLGDDEAIGRVRAAAEAGDGQAAAILGRIDGLAS